MSYKRVRNPVLQRRLERIQTAEAVETPWISTACKRGQHSHGCCLCFSLKCTCNCHKRCVPSPGRKVRISSPKGEVRGEFTIKSHEEKTIWLDEPLPKTIQVGDSLEVVDERLSTQHLNDVSVLSPDSAYPSQQDQPSSPLPVPSSTE